MGYNLIIERNEGLTGENKMTYQQAIETAKEQYKNTDILTIKEVAMRANENLETPDFVFDAVLSILEERMPEVDFCDFCDNL